MYSLSLFYNIIMYNNENSILQNDRAKIEAGEQKSAKKQKR